VVYGLYSLAWPLGPGRDLGTYLRVYIQLFDPHAVYPQAMAARTPIAPLVVGGLLDAGAVVAELAMAVLYALSVLAWCAVARRFGPAAAVATAVGLLLFPGYVMLFHELSSDSVYAAAFAFTAPLVARAIERPSVGRAAALGGAVAALVLARPSSQVFLLLALVPLLAPGVLRQRLVRSAAFAAAAVLPLAGWAVHNGIRFDDYTVARGGGATLPFFRAFVVDKIVKPDNGPASRELARAVEQRLLTREPYRSYGITLDEFFSSGSGRMHEDFIGLSDRTWGWDDDYAHVAAAGREAVRAHPGTYVRGVVRDFGILLRTPLSLGVTTGGDDGGSSASSAPQTITVNGRVLPKPTEDELIPAARQSGFVSTPDGRISEVWTSPTAHHIEYRDPADARRAAELDRRLNAAYDVFSDRGGSTFLQRWLDRAARWYPRSILLVLVGGIALLVRRPRGWAIPAVLAGTALLLGATTMLAVYPTAEYVVPVTPAFVLLTAVGLLGRDATAPAYSRLRTATWWPAKTRSA
jgi:hypothetical protein